MNIKTTVSEGIHLMDLTSLTDNETKEDIKKLCEQANTICGKTAAICIFPRFIPYARKILSEQGTPEIRIATVVNFPEGDSDIEIAVRETKAAISYGADEVDVVFPYKKYLEGDKNIGFDLVKACKDTCGDTVLLKVIIETGILQNESLIKEASAIAIKAGADFIKTSTGKVPINATLESSQFMLEVIKDLGVADSVGFKPAGGVKTVEDVKNYLTLARSILGDSWVDQRHFRFGASSLMNNLLNAMHGIDVKEDPNLY